MQFPWAIVVGKVVKVTVDTLHTASVVVYAPTSPTLSNLYFSEENSLDEWLATNSPIEPPQSTDTIWQWRFFYTDTPPKVGDHCLVTDSYGEVIPISYTDNECYKTYLTHQYNYGDRLVPAGYSLTIHPSKHENLWLEEGTNSLWSTKEGRRRRTTCTEYGPLVVDTSKNNS